MITQILRVLTCGRSSQNYLGSPVVPLMLKMCPPAWRQRLAMELSAISPHYFVCRNSDRYHGLTRRELFEAELRRNAESRRLICQGLLLPYLRSQMHVVDFGCGLGFLGAEVARHCDRVTAVDLSRGVVACARVFHPNPNVDFRVLRDNRLSWLGDATVDLVYTFAVLQHVSDALMEVIVGEYFRVLKPGGQALCHIAVGTAGSVGNSVGLRRYALLMVTRTAEDVLGMARKVGFEADAVPIRELCNLEDDIGASHLFRLSKPVRS